VENAISLLRPRLKKERNLDRISDKDIKTIESLINHRPRKCLNFRTPYEILSTYGVALNP
jgi:IS30 family transposase